MHRSGSKCEEAYKWNQCPEVCCCAPHRDPPFTNATSNFTGCLDYIFLRGPFTVIEILEMPYEDKQGSDSAFKDLRKDFRFGPIVNDDFPSDHLSICCGVQLHHHQ